MTNRLRQLIIAMPLVFACGYADGADVHGIQVDGCGYLANAYGPFDFRTATFGQIDIVEKYHFNADVENLKTGISTAYVVNELDYTLRALPNHPRALSAVVRYELSGGQFNTVQIKGAECYLRRALTLASDDATVYLIYGNYLFKSGQIAKADEMYANALRLSPDSAETAYNAGLYYVAKGDLDKAESLAKVAYDQGYPLPGLRKQIDAAKQRSSDALAPKPPARKPK